VSQEPRIEERAAQHYAGIQATVAMEGISAAVDEAFPELFGWLAKTGTASAGPPHTTTAWNSTCGTRRKAAPGDPRFEEYITDPSAEPDPGKWETDVAYLLRG
jgi:hypothetical protein